MKNKLALLHRTVTINGVDIFYRIAGDSDNPALFLLHGLPTSSLMFKSLMLALSDRYYLIAPDFPGFGFSGFPDPNKFEYTFGNFANIMEALVNELKLEKFAVYMHDYGCNVGMRLCMSMPERITGIIVQDGNSYKEGHGAGWEEAIKYWENPTPEMEQEVLGFLSEEGTKDQYMRGLPDDVKETIGPENYTVDWYIMSQPGRVAMQKALNIDYKNNIALFPKIQGYLKEHQPPALIIWGKYDAYFEIEEAYCYHRDLKDSELHILEGGHKLLETNFHEVRDLVAGFMERILNNAAG